MTSHNKTSTSTVAPTKTSTYADKRGNKTTTQTDSGNCYGRVPFRPAENKQLIALMSKKK
jgi:hypothetical protein